MCVKGGRECVEGGSVCVEGGECEEVGSVYGGSFMQRGSVSVEEGGGREECVLEFSMLSCVRGRECL